MVRRHVRRARALAAYAHTGAWRGRRARFVLALAALLVGVGAFVVTAQRAEEPRSLEASGAPEAPSAARDAPAGEPARGEGPRDAPRERPALRVASTLRG